MISIFICEDDQKQREELEKIVENYLMSEDLDMKLALSTENPQDVLDYMEEHPNTLGIYFLDIDLQHEMNGIELGGLIRKNYDAHGKIIFITTHGERAYLTFMHKVEALDFVIKGLDDIASKVQACIKVANHHLSVNKANPINVYQVKIGERIYRVPYEEIMFFESSEKPHNLILHLDNGQLEFRASIREVVEKSPVFFRCHKSYVINKNNVKEVDKKAGIIEMVNGEKILISLRKVKLLEQEMKI